MNGGAERRDRRQFEPPPWERDAFDRFRKAKEEEEKDAALEAALSNLQEPQELEETKRAEPAVERDVPPREPAADQGSREYPIPASTMEELMAGLRDEEPRARVEYKGVSNVVTAVLGAGGLGFIIWAGILLSKAGPNANGLQMMASLLVMVWGFMLIGFAVVLWRKHNL